jgi:hypothetical protein
MVHLQGCFREIAFRPNEDAPGPDMDVEQHVVPAGSKSKIRRRYSRRLLGLVRRLRVALHQHRRGSPDRSPWVAEEQRYARVAPGVERLLRQTIEVVSTNRPSSGRQKATTSQVIGVPSRSSVKNSLARNLSKTSSTSGDRFVLSATLPFASPALDISFPLLARPETCGAQVPNHAPRPLRPP